VSARIHAITIDELLALNDEIRAIARTGIPLEIGIKAIGQDLPGRLGRLADLIGQRMERGESLATVVSDPNLALPSIYCAVVAAGVRSGRLPAALESLSRSVQRAAELRRTVVASFVYPLILLLLATVVFVFTWRVVFPQLRESIGSLVEKTPPTWLQWLTLTSDYGFVWLASIWGVVIVLGGIWLIRSRRASRFATGWRRWPTIGSVNAAGRSAAFAEMLALLLEQQVPFIEALCLAGAANGDRRIRAAAENLADRIRSGQKAGPAPPGMPPLLSWLILTNAPSAQLIRILRQTAASQREYAQRVGVFLAVYLPIVFSAIVGGCIAVYYAVLMMVPFIYLLYELGQP
jgi:type II secretory pathway component PulF